MRNSCPHAPIMMLYLIRMKAPLLRKDYMLMTHCLLLRQKKHLTTSEQFVRPWCHDHVGIDIRINVGARILTWRVLISIMLRKIPIGPVMPLVKVSSSIVLPLHELEAGDLQCGTDNQA